MSLVRSRAGTLHSPDSKVLSIFPFLFSITFYFVILRLSFYRVLPPLNNIWYINFNSSLEKQRLVERTMK